MTTLARPVKRETTDYVRSAGKLRPLVVTLTLSGIALRQKGCRTTYLLPYGIAWMHAAILAADLARHDRLAKKKRKRS